MTSQTTWQPYTLTNSNYLRLLDDEEITTNGNSNFDVPLQNPHPEILTFWDFIYAYHFVDAESTWSLTDRNDENDEATEETETETITEDNTSTEENTNTEEGENDDNEGNEEDNEGSPDSASTAVGYTFAILTMFALLDRFHNIQILS